KAPSARRGLDVELAEIWLFRQGDPARAAACCRDLLAQEPGHRGARQLLALALAAQKQWDELCQHLADSPAEDADALLEGARLELDGAGGAKKAAKLAQAALEGESALLYTLELLLELSALGATQTEPLLEKKIAALGDEPRAAAERAAAQFRLAELREPEDPEGARTIYGQLSSEPSGFGTRLALLARRRLAAQQGRWDEVAHSLRELGRTGTHPQLARAYLRRAAEILETRIGEAARAEDAWAELFAADPGDRSAARALERLRIGRGAWAELIACEEAHARARADARSQSLRRASIMVEMRTGDLESAARLRRESLFEGDLSGLAELARLYRRMGDRVRLCSAYRRAASELERRANAGAADETGGRSAAVLHAAIGALQLSLGHVREAEESLHDAIQRAPDDLFAHAALAWIYRRSSRPKELSEALHELIPLIATESARGNYWRELGRVAGERLADGKTARHAFEQALALQPNDATSLHALSKMLAEAGDWQPAVELRERAVESAGESLRASVMLLEIGEIYEKHLHDDDKARGAYERALHHDPNAVGALRALAQLHRKAKRAPELLDVLRRELALASEPSRRVTLHLEIARNEDAVGGSGEAALEHYREALKLDPGNAPALAGLERICRRDGRWEVLVASLRAAPRSPRTARSLAEALEKLGKWQELAEVRRLELELVEDPKESARVARLLGQLYEERLGDADQAARYYRRALELDHEDPTAARALARMYDARGRFTDL